MYQVFTTADLLGLGYSDREVRAAVGCCLERIARGRFVVRRRCGESGHRRIWEPLEHRDADGFRTLGDFRDVLEQVKVLIRARADLLNRRKQSQDGTVTEVFSHLSAALLWQFAVVKMPQPRVEVVRADANKRHAHLHIRRRDLPEGHINRLGDTMVTSKERTLIDVARDFDLDLSVPMIDDALRKGMVTNAGLRDALEQCAEVRNTRRVEQALDLAHPGRESPGESIVAVRLHEILLTGFEPQVEIFDEHGIFVARVDFAHRESKIIIEFDGRVKYTLDGQDHRRAFDRERERDRRLRALGYHVVRVFWKDLWHRQTFTNIARLVGSRLPSRTKTR